MLVNYLKSSRGLSIKRACGLLNLSPATYYRHPKPSDEDEIIAAELKALAIKHKQWGCDKMTAYLRNTGKCWNHKRIHRIYTSLNLAFRHKPKQHFVRREPEILFQPLYPNLCWSMDFMSDALESKIKFRSFNVIDDYHRKAIGLIAGFSMPAEFVTKQLDRWCSLFGYPEKVRVDNGPEFTSIHFVQWAKTRGIEVRYIQPGKPAQNAYIERFNRTYRSEVLDAHQFQSINQVNDINAQWIVEYNTVRPHAALGNLSPKQFAERRENMIRKKQKSNKLGQKFQF